jgi:DNA-binding GntR family transcriptional regulator
MLATSRIYPPEECARITAAETVSAPDDVVAALGLSVGAAATRRQRVIRREGEAVEASTSWYDAGLAAVAERLTQQERLHESTVAYLEGVTGRRAVLA